ncbi:MAG: protein kinase [Epsilonproteobacteria bacterium]|nr:protein kinase [Campylobacterota bacterium]
MQKRLTVSVSQYSTKGRKEINQDFYDLRIPKVPLLSTKGIAIALADGISSSQVSQVASKVAVSSFLADYFSTPESWTVKTSAHRVLTATNAWLYAQNHQNLFHLDKDRGYLCTFSALVLRSTTAYLFHVGDTRIYRFRDGHFEQLTEDHRLWVSQNESYLSRAVGMDSHLTIDYERFDIEEGDLFLLMTDGVYEHVNKAFMQQMIVENQERFENSAKMIVDQAYAQGSSDNLTIQLVRVDALPSKNIDEINLQLENKSFPPRLEPRERFDGYEIVRVLSSSSRSHVYLAYDQERETSVVIKALAVESSEDRAYLERFLMEEWIARRINNAHVLRAYPQSQKRNYIYNVTEYIEGETLTQWMIDHPKPTLEVVRKLIEQIAKGLYAFHKLEMIHQDIRPENIIIDKTGTVKIIDFGSTKVEGIKDINTGIEQENLQGTALYSAPEYFIGLEGSFRSDIFSVGVIMYQMLSGKSPYGVKVARTQTKAAQKKLKYQPLALYRSDIPIWVDKAIQKSLSVDPSARYGELSEFIYDIYNPNKKFLTQSNRPLVEENPLLFWQLFSFSLGVIIVFLLLRS